MLKKDFKTLRTLGLSLPSGSVCSPPCFINERITYSSRVYFSFICLMRRLNSYCYWSAVRPSCAAGELEEFVMIMNEFDD